MAITLTVKYVPITGFSTAEHDTDTMAKTVTISSDQVLDIRFANIDTFTLSRKTYAEFPVEIVSDECNTSTDYTYQWSLISGPSEDIGTVLTDSQSLHKLIVRRWQLSTYGAYIFQVAVSNANLSGEKQLTLTLEAPDLVAILNIPNSEQSVSNALNLDASKSYDPDDSTTDLSFRWSCTDSSGITCVDQSGSAIFTGSVESESSKTLPANT